MRTKPVIYFAGVAAVAPLHVHNLVILLFMLDASVSMVQAPTRKKDVPWDNRVRSLEFWVQA